MGQKSAGKHAGGRPSKYDPAFCEQVVAAGADGYSLTSFAGKIDVARSTINEWISEHAEFSEAVKRHKAKRSLWWEEKLRSIATVGGGPGAATAVIFGLKNVAPDEYADRVVTEHTGKDGGPIQTSSRLDLTDLAPDERDAVREILSRRVGKPTGGAD